MTIPFAVKIGPFFSALPSFAARLIAAGASGLVLFNRYLEPEINLQSLRIQPYLELSQPHEHRLVLRWLGILRDQMSNSLAATSGIHTADELLKSLLAGANVTMLATALLQRGPEAISEILEKLERWLVEHETNSVEQIISTLSRNRCADTTAFERANYVKALVAYVNTNATR